MKIKYLSDLHLEFGGDVVDYFTDNENVDCIVIAGDISNSKNNATALMEIADLVNPIPVLYVGGNHDYYHGNKIDTNLELMYLDNLLENFHYINHKSIEIGDVIFLGATGWQNNPDFNKYNFYIMNDFRLIKDHNDDVNSCGDDDFEFLQHELSKYVNRKVVVVTHIIPCAEGINWGTPEVTHKQSYIEAYYNDWECLLDDFLPNLWICGHCHDSIDTFRGDVRIVRNAHGYKNNQRINKDYNYNKIIEI